MDGSRRARATSVLLRCSPPDLFKGHLSTKSNAFCTDSSSLRLSTLHLVKNHMAVHYNKILSAKAIVDCSVPLSMSTSIKYADQQRREKLKKELAQCERGLKLTKTAMRANSKNNSKSLNTLQKPSGEPHDEDGVLLKEVNGFPSFTRSRVTSSERLHLSAPKSSKVLTNSPEKNSSSSQSSMDYTTSGPRKPCSGTVYGRRPRSTVPNSYRFELVISKAPSGDLLDKHSELFSNRHLPFTPRTLKTEAKSFLSQYRYYTPAKRKKDLTDQRIQAETQAGLISSFKPDFETVETKNFKDSELQASSCMTVGTQGKISPLPVEVPGSPWDKVKDGARQCSSSRFLERLFERHIKQNKHHLEEEKMRHLLRVLKVDLGCTSKENSVKLDDVNTLNLLDFEKAKNSEQNEYKNEQDTIIQQERQEYQKALDMLLSAPKDENEILSSPGEFFLPVYKSKYSEGVIIRQVNDETNLGPSIWDEKNPSISSSFTDQETSVNVIEVDNDTEKAETSAELCLLSTALSQPLQFRGVKGDNNHDVEEPTLKIMEMSIGDCPLDV
uniref:Spermatosis associated 7 n=1 Tax=Equus caballus TaxID=9796 RepID=A0A9L0RXW0_HORSE